jgi:hypothetical protein
LIVKRQRFIELVDVLVVSQAVQQLRPVDLTVYGVKGPFLAIDRGFWALGLMSRPRSPCQVPAKARSGPSSAKVSSEPSASVKMSSGYTRSG